MSTANAVNALPSAKRISLTEDGTVVLIGALIIAPAVSGLILPVPSFG